MALPSALKNFNLFNDAKSFMGIAESIKLPKLSRKFEDFRGAGMDGEVGIDLGQEKLEMDWDCAGINEQIFLQYGATKVDGVMLRFAGAYQRDDTAKVQAVEVVVRGRHQEIDSGEAKAGDKGKMTIKSRLTYYKLSIDNKALVEIDLLNMIFIVNGVDLLAEQRKAIGLA
ncbi:MAG: phage major tail tube protein [Nitrosomonadales bacterium]|nr:phage major tail tube protein [Nitrosomonadales bacterium]